MDAKLADRIDSILGYIETSLKGAESFAKVQTPELVRQLLRWEVVGNCMYLVWITLLSAGTVALQTFCYRGMMAEGDSSGYGLMFFVLFAFEALLLLWFACTLDAIVQVRVAPKVFLLKYVKGLLTPPEKSGS